ncbi:MAG: AbrB/MazE/SpoVT family DNA-binding domain-containing protein [Acidobacteria bacterium]|nr:AbrB/MazE/SpoVT family DNA-binding domain-containing protein [Acidobacteriota bacterium]
MVIEIPESGKIKIPNTVERELGLVPGTRVSLEIEDGKFVIRKVGPEVPHWSEGLGMLRDDSDETSMLDDLAEERAAELARDDERLKRFR